MGDSVQKRQDALYLPWWYGGPLQVELDLLAVLEGEAQSSTVHCSQLSGVQVDLLAKRPQQTGHTVTGTTLVDLSDGGHHKVGTGPEERQGI